jgi:hypothetical protein
VIRLVEVGNPTGDIVARPGSGKASSHVHGVANVADALIVTVEITLALESQYTPSRQ